MNQPTLFDGINHPYRVAYEKFKDANPWVLPRLAYLAEQLKNRGYTHYGMRALIEVLRYEYHSTMDPSSDFKFNNNYAPFMTRDVMAAHPHLDGFFDTRKSVADLK